MKTKLTLALQLFSISLFTILAGCKTSPTDIVSYKETVFGLDVSTSPQTQIPRVRLGLVRNYFQRIPTSGTNIFAPGYTAHVNAATGLTSQSAVEDTTTK